MPRRFGFQCTMYQQTRQSKQDNHSNQGSRMQINRATANGSVPVGHQHHHNQGSSMQNMPASASGSHPVGHEYCEVREMMISGNRGSHHQQARLGQKRQHGQQNGLRIGSSIGGLRFPSHGISANSHVSSNIHNDASKAASEALRQMPNVGPSVVTFEEMTYVYRRG